MKLDLEIAVVQQIEAHDRTFDGVPFYLLKPIEFYRFERSQLFEYRELRYGRFCSFVCSYLIPDSTVK